jgi:hypothetical protein
LLPEDAVEIAANVAEDLSDRAEGLKTDAKFGCIAAVLLSSVLVVVLTLKPLWKEFAATLLAVAVSCCMYVVYKYVNAATLERVVKAQQLKLELAVDAQDPSHPLPGPVKVGFLDTSLSLPVLRYCFRFCR